MNRDHPTLVDIWSRLRKKRNVIAFVETDTPEDDLPTLTSWFEPITKDQLSKEDILIQNGTFLCFRPMLAEMPVIDPRVTGDYDIVVIPQQVLKQIKQGLENEV